MINKSSLYVSKPLTNISIAYTNNEYIAEKILPVVPVVIDTAKIVTYGMDNLRIEESLRAQGSGANEINHTVSIGDHYVLADHALKEFVTDEEEENADLPINPRIDATENLVGKMFLIKERELSLTMENTGVITQNVTLTGTDQWSDYDNSDPLADISTGISTVFDNSGMYPNAFVMSYAVMLKLITHPAIQDLVRNVPIMTADIAVQALKSAFPGIENIYVGKAKYNSGLEGGTDALANVWGKHFWVGFINPKPTLKSRSLGYTYQKKGQNRRTELLPYDADKKGQYVRVNDKYDQKLIDNKCFYLIKNAIA